MCNIVILVKTICPILLYPVDCTSFMRHPVLTIYKLILVSRVAHVTGEP